MNLSANELLKYSLDAVTILLERDSFMNGDPLRPTQKDSLTHYKQHLQRTDLTTEQRLSYFAEIPMGVGKTAVFLGMFEEIYKLARADNKDVSGVVIVPFISLLDQMPAQIRKYAPSLSHDTGYYGDGKKDVDKALSIITYIAWIELTESGKLHPGNAHFMVSDESHRGTSEARMDVMLKNFVGKVISFAVTATGSFDEEKTIEKTHGPNGFRRKPNVSVELGELAAYVQSQLHIIRVSPQKASPTPDENDEESDSNNRRVAYELRKKAWTDRVVAILRDGKDEHTQEHLSDNISAFYVADIDHAKKTEAALNQDPVLSKKAKDMGFDDVAVTIHSKMTRKEKKRRMDAFNNGQYMAIVGDSMFKEGYDNARIKNIFDFPRSSIVDKLQIVGRGLRQFFNKLKNRWEGATVIDTVVYIGSDDPIEDKRLKEEAIMNAVKAWDVLNGAVVYGPGVKPSDKKPVTGSLPPANIDGQTVESITTLEGIETIRSLIESIAAAYVNLDTTVDGEKTYRDILVEEKIRTDLGSKAILNRLKEQGLVVEGQDDELKPSTLENWYNIDRGLRWVRTDRYKMVMAAYQDAETATLVPKIDLDAKDPITKISSREKLIAEKKRTGFGATAIFTRLKEKAQELGLQIREGLNHQIIYTWQNYTQFSNAPTDWLNAVLKVYEHTETAPINPRIHLDKKDTDAEFTPRERLLAERDRTGLAAIAIFERLQDRAEEEPEFLIPEGLNESIINGWLKPSSKTTTAITEWFNVVIDAYKTAKPLVELDAVDETNPVSVRQRLFAESERTGLKSHAIFTKLKEIAEAEGIKLHKNMNADIVGTWFRPNHKTRLARKEWLDLIFNAYSKSDDKVVRPRKNHAKTAISTGSNTPSKG